MNKKKILCFCLALGAFSAMMAQETLSLSQCLQMAVENNLSLQKSRNESIPSARTRRSCCRRLMPWHS